MKPARVTSVVLCVAGLAGVAGASLAFCPAPGGVSPEAARRDVAAGLVQVEARAVRAETVRLEADLAAVLGPARSVRIAAEVEGRVVEVPVDEHTEVDAGELLVQVERSLLEAAAARAEAAVGRAQANYQLAQLELERQRGLADRRVGSEAELDRARSTERARLAELREAEAARDDARVRLAKASIRAPFAGVVSRLDLEPGSYLRPGDFVAELLDLAEIEIEVGLTDRQVVEVRAGDAVALEVDVFPGERFDGAVERVGRAPHAETQKYPVQVRVSNTARRLLPGMLGRVRFELGAARRAIRIPRRATQREYDLDYVFVLDGRPDAPVAVRRRIVARPVPFRPDLIEVAEGLREGERIATSGVRDLRDGLAVRVRPARP